MKSMKVMIVEDDDILRRSFVRALREWTTDVTETGSLQEARQALEQAPDLIILDVNLPDGSGVVLAEEISHIKPMPMTIAVSGEASAEQAFQLKEYGVQGYLSKPLSLSDFKKALREQLEKRPNIEPHLSALVGKSTYKMIHNEVRKTVLEQALSKEGGNISKAARLLDVSRQAVQQMINDYQIDIDQYK